VRETIINPQDLKAEKVLNIGQNLDGPNVLAEFLRSELSARRLCSRRALCSKVAVMLSPLQPTSVDDAKLVLAELETNGDVTSGSQGQVAASPLRAVQIGKDRYRLYGSIPSQKLFHTFQGAALTCGLNRLLSSNESKESISDKIAALGGIVLNPERWAGLHKAPRADMEWLSSLDTLLENRGIPAGSLDNGINDLWQTYIPNERNKPQNDRWKKSGQEEVGKLWRAWHERGWYLFAWTSEKSPSLSPCIKLSSDHARRTMFAMDRECNNPVPVSFSEKKERVLLRIAGFLPVAEYRYLSIIGEFTGKQENYYCFEIPSDSWPDVCQIIHDRLGMKEGQE
jgi:hypothetical protein